MASHREMASPLEMIGGIEMVIESGVVLDRPVTAAQDRLVVSLKLTPTLQVETTELANVKTDTPAETPVKREGGTGIGGIEATEEIEAIEVIEG